MNESLDTGIYYGPNADSLALRTLAYKAMLWPGQDEDAPLEVIPWSIRRPYQRILSDHYSWRNWPQRRDSTQPGGGE